MKILKNIFKSLAIFAMEYVYNYLDKDKDGLISKLEIEDFTRKIKEVLECQKKRKRKKKEY